MSKERGGEERRKKNR
jgi:hypothetical protein